MKAKYKKIIACSLAAAVIAAVSAKAKPSEVAMGFRIFISLLVAAIVGYTFYI